MKFGRDNLNEKFYFGNNVLDEISDVRYLGIQMDSRLTFESHFNSFWGKVAKLNVLLFKGRNYFSKNVLVKFITAMQSQSFRTFELHLVQHQKAF